jgi:uncharacterized membrane protein required for colicin V production
MIAAAVQKTTPWWQTLSFSWFDVVVVLTIAFGFWRGRKHGMSREALPTALWLVLVIGGGFGCRLLGDLVQPTGYIRQIFGTSANERTMSYVLSYLVITFVCLIIYSQLTKVFREKVSGSNAFGNGEYYLGTVSGMIRYACILIFILAFLNAPYYSAADIAAQKAYNNRWYGGGMKDYSGDFIPSVSEIQSSVFKDSMIGQAIKSNLSALLIESSSTTKLPVKKKS